MLSWFKCFHGYIELDAEWSVHIYIYIWIGLAKPLLTALLIVIYTTFEGNQMRPESMN